MDRPGKAAYADERHPHTGHLALSGLTACAVGAAGGATHLGGACWSLLLVQQVIGVGKHTIRSRTY